MWRRASGRVRISLVRCLLVCLAAPSIQSGIDASQSHWGCCFVDLRTGERSRLTDITLSHQTSPQLGIADCRSPERTTAQYNVRVMTGLHLSPLSTGMLGLMGAAQSCSGADWALEHANAWNVGVNSPRA